MIVVDFPGVNLTLKPPEGQTEEQCSTIPCFHGLDAKQREYYLIAVKPSYEDLKAINAGKPILIKWQAAEGRYAVIAGLWELLLMSGYTYVDIVTGYYPGESEILALNGGGNLWIKMVSNTGFPPISVWTEDENNQPNE